MQNRGKCRNDGQNLKDLKSAIEKMDNPQDKLTAQCMVVLLSALGVGADVDRLTKETGYPRDFIDSISRRMREAGLWIEERVDDREWWGRNGNLIWAFFAHALVAQGQCRREGMPAGGWRYISMNTGEVVGEWSSPG